MVKTKLLEDNREGKERGRGERRGGRLGMSVFACSVTTDPS